MNKLTTSMQTITDFDNCRQSPLPQQRLEAVRKAAQGFREHFMDEPEVLFYKSINLIRVPYPTWYGLAVFMLKVRIGFR